MGAKNWDVLVESLLEKWPVLSEGDGTGTGGSTPEGKHWKVSNELLGLHTENLGGGLEDWTGDVLQLC